MKLISLATLARILDLKYSQVYYYCQKNHYLGKRKYSNRVYYSIKISKCVAKKLIDLSSKDLNQVLQEIDEY